MTSAQWLQVLASYSLQATIVIAVAGALDRWTRSADGKSRIWNACYFSLLGLLAAGLLLPRLHWLHPWSRLGPDQLLAVASMEHILGRALLALWLLGGAVMVARSVVQSWRIQSFVAGCARVAAEDDNWMRSLVPARLLSPGGKEAQFRVSPEVIGPFCYQFHKPIVLIPRSLIDGDRTELRHVLEHELTHLRTNHPLQLFLQKVAQCILWFHPLVWISSKRASLIREFVCDDAATHDAASTASYLRTLLRVMEKRTHGCRGVLAIGRSPSELRIRAERLVYSSRRSSLWQARLAMAWLCAVAVFTSQIWLPTDPLVPLRSRRSPWPSWTATVLHSLNLSAPDFEPFDGRTQLHELYIQAEGRSSD